MRIRIVWFIDSLGLGGAEHLMPVILSHFDTSRFEHRVCTFSNRFGNPNAVNIKELGIPVDEVPIPNLRNPGNLPRLLRYLTHYQPDIIHTQLEFSNTLGSLAAACLRIPTVCTLHVMENKSNRSREYWRHRLMWTSLQLFCNKIFAVSENARQFFIQTEHLAPQKVHTLYNGIDLSLFHFDMDEYLHQREEFNIPLETKVFITIAYLREPKGIQYMLQAFPTILAVHPDCHYLIVGEGEHKTVLQNLARDLCIENNVTFTGIRQDVPALLAMSDIFVLPTLNDALPTVLVEAMASAKPIIASHVGGIPEMVSDGENGLLVPPQDPVKLAEACIDLLNNPEKAKNMGKSGLQVASDRFSIEIQCRQLENYYQQLVLRK